MSERAWPLKVWKADMTVKQSFLNSTKLTKRNRIKDQRIYINDLKKNNIYTSIFMKLSA